MNFVIYLRDLFDLCFELQAFHEKNSWYYQFYNTCIDMLANDCELTEKQLFWVNRDAIVHGLQMPTGNELKLSLPVFVTLTEKIEFEKHDLSIFFDFLNSDHAYARDYERDFENGVHVLKWHTKK